MKPHICPISDGNLPLFNLRLIHFLTPGYSARYHKQSLALIYIVKNHLLAIKMSLQGFCKQGGLANGKTFAFCKQQLQAMEQPGRGGNSRGCPRAVGGGEPEGTFPISPEPIRNPLGCIPGLSSRESWHAHIPISHLLWEVFGVMELSLHLSGLVSPTEGLDESPNAEPEDPGPERCSTRRCHGAAYS